MQYEDSTNTYTVRQLFGCWRISYRIGIAWHPMPMMPGYDTRIQAESALERLAQEYGLREVRG